MRDGFGSVVECLDGGGDEAEACDAWVFGGRVEEDLEADAYTEIGLARVDVGLERFIEAAVCQVGDGGLEGADAWKDESLRWRSVRMSSESRVRETYVCVGKVVWRLDPFEVVAKDCEGVGETPDVASAVVEKIERHARYHSKLNFIIYYDSLNTRRVCN